LGKIDLRITFSVCFIYQRPVLSSSSSSAELNGPHQNDFIKVQFLATTLKATGKFVYFRYIVFCTLILEFSLLVQFTICYMSLIVYCLYYFATFETLWQENDIEELFCPIKANSKGNKGMPNSRMQLKNEPFH